MKRIKLLSLMLLLCSLVFSQTVGELSKTIDFNDFKTYDYSRKFLLFDGQFSFDSQSEKSSSEFASSLNGNLNFNLINNSKYRHNQINLRFGTGYSHTQRKITDLQSHSFFGSIPDLIASYYSRNYLTDNFFMSYGIYASVYGAYLSKEQNDSYIQNELIAGIRANPSVGIGYGRSDMVSTVERIISITQELENDNLLARPLEYDDLIKLSSLQTKLQSIYFKDQRLQQRYQLAAMDSAFHSLGLVSEKDMRYFLALDDYWKYGQYINRSKGGSVSLSFSPVIHYRHTKQYTEDPNEITGFYMYRTVFGYVYDKPLNLKWQWNLRANLSHTYSKKYTGIGDADWIYNLPENTYGLNIYSTLQFYPNSRTYYNLSTSLGWDYSNYTLEEGGEKIWEMSPVANIELSAYHYLTPRLHIEGVISYRYNHYSERYIDYSDFDPSTKWNGYLKLGYWIL